MHIYHSKDINSLENRAVVLISPNQNFRYGPQRFHEQTPVVFGNRLIPGQNIVKIFQMFQRMGILRPSPSASKPTSTSEHVYEDQKSNVLSPSTTLMKKNIHIHICIAFFEFHKRLRFMFSIITYK